MKVRKIISAIMALAMVVSVMSVGVYAADPTEVATYEALVAALEVGGEIKLTANITVDTAVTVQDGTTLDLNGNNIYWNVENSYFGDATITNTVFDDYGFPVGGIVLGKDDVHVCDGYFLVKEGKTLTIQNVNITSSADGMKCYAVFHLKEGADINLADSYITISDNEYAGSIIYAGNANSDVNIEYCEIQGTDIGRGIANSNVTLAYSYITLTGTKEGGLEHGLNVSSLTVEGSDITVSGGSGRGITAREGNITISGESEVTIYSMGEATIELRGETVTISDDSTVTIDKDIQGEDGAELADGAVVGAENIDEYVYPVYIEDKGYANLVAAVGDAEDGATVTLLTDIEGAGIVIDKNLTIDFGKNTYTVNSAVGSQGTETLAFQILAGSGAVPYDVTLKNGTIKVVEEPAEGSKEIKAVIMNYSNLTLEDMIVDGTGNTEMAYALSTNNGAAEIKGNTSIMVNDGVYAAIDVDGSQSYYGEASLIINTAGTIAGKVEIYGNEATTEIKTGTFKDDITVSQKGDLAISGGTFEGTITINNSDDTEENTTDLVVSGGKFSEGIDEKYVAEDVVIAQNPDGSYRVVEEAYYKLTFESNGGTEFEALEEQLNGEEIDLSEYVPEREGYTFGGWYADGDLTRAVETVVLDADTTVYAAWTKNVTSSGNGGLQAGGDTSRTGADDLTDGKEETDSTENTDNDNVENVPSDTDSEPFTDVNANDWFDDSVKYVYENGLMNGTSADKFSPNSSLTRAMLVTVLYRAEGSPATNKSIPFGDVDMGAYYADAVIWAKQNGIVNGVTENDFAPNANITREQIAAILHRYASFKGYDMSASAELTGFADAKSVSEYAVEAMKYAVGAGIINGKTATTVNPLDNATRAEIATILQRLIEGNK